MAFVDECVVVVEAGRGGSGSASLHSEPFKPRGGPDGGNGGPGGSVIFEVSGGVRDLSWLADHPHLRASDGRPGRSSKRDGAAGQDLVVHVPDGTVVFDEEGLIADLVGEGSRAVVAHGGRGGRGNAQLAGPRNRVPRVAEPGEEGERCRLRVELRTVADVGLVGLPNAGKSTLLARLTAAKPKIGDYPFTTLTPNLGVAGTDRRYVVADVPGLIEGASQGRGLGDRFLRHVMRCRVLVLVVDLSSPDPADDLRILRAELEAFDPGLASKPCLVVGTKEDLIPDPVRPEPGALVVSSVTGEGLDELAGRLEDLVAGVAASEPERTSYVVHRPGRPRFTVERDAGGVWHVRGRTVERWVMETDLDDAKQVGELQRRLKKEGVDRKLREMGAGPGDEIEIKGHLFEYVADETP